MYLIELVLSGLGLDERRKDFEVVWDFRRKLAKNEQLKP